MGREAAMDSDGQVAKTAAWIAEGRDAPILVDSDAGIIAGYYRILAARKLNLTEVRVAVLDGLAGIKERACREREGQENA